MTAPTYRSGYVPGDAGGAFAAGPLVGLVAGPADGGPVSSAGFTVSEPDVVALLDALFAGGFRHAPDFAVVHVVPGGCRVLVRGTGSVEVDGADGGVVVTAEGVLADRYVADGRSARLALGEQLRTPLLPWDGATGPVAALVVDLVDLAAPEPSASPESVPPVPPAQASTEPPADARAEPEAEAGAASVAGTAAGGSAPAAHNVYAQFTRRNRPPVVPAAAGREVAPAAPPTGLPEPAGDAGVAPSGRAAMDPAAAAAAEPAEPAEAAPRTGPPAHGGAAGPTPAVPEPRSPSEAPDAVVVRPFPHEEDVAPPAGPLIEAMPGFGPPPGSSAEPFAPPSPQPAPAAVAPPTPQVPPAASSPVTVPDSAPAAPTPTTAHPVALEPSDGDPGEGPDDAGRTVKRSALGVDAGGAGGPLVPASRCPAGHLNAPHATTCRVCRAAVPAQDPVQARRPVLGRLVIEGVPEPIVLDRDAVLGRSPRPPESANPGVPQLVRIHDPRQEVSGQHALVNLNAWDVLLVDLGSTNGTEIVTAQGRRQRLVPHSPVVVEPGTTIVLAEIVSLRFEALA